MGSNNNNRNLYSSEEILTVSQRAAYKAWATRRRNARHADYHARGLKAWATRRQRQNYSQKD